MEDEIKQKISKANDLRHVLPQLLGVDEPLVVLRMFAADDSAQGELWIANGSKIVQASAKASASFGYLAALELLAQKPHRFKVEPASSELMSNTIDISIEDLIADQTAVIQSIKSILWPIEEPSGPLAVEVQSEADSQVEHDSTPLDDSTPSVSEEDADAAQPDTTLSSADEARSVSFEPPGAHSVLFLEPAEGQLDDLQTKMKADVETAAKLTSWFADNEFANNIDTTQNDDQPDDQVHLRLKQYEQLKDSGEAKEVFYAETSPELDPTRDKTDENHKLDLESVKLTQTTADASLFDAHDAALGGDETLYHTLEAEEPIIDSPPDLSEYEHLESVQPSPDEIYGTSLYADDRPARIATGTWRTLKSFNEPLTEDLGLVNREVTADHEVIGVAIPRVKRLEVSKPLTMSLLAAALALPLCGFFLVQLINYERHIDKYKAQAGAYQTDQSMDDQSLSGQLQEPFRLPAPESASPLARGAGTGDGTASGQEADGLSKSKWQPPKHPSAPLGADQIAEIKTQLQLSEGLMMRGQIDEAVRLLTAQVQKYPHNAALKIALISAYTRLKDYVNARLWCRSGLGDAQNETEYLTFMNLLRHIPGGPHPDSGTVVSPPRSSPAFAPASSPTRLAPPAAPTATPAPAPSVAAPPVPPPAPPKAATHSPSGPQSPPLPQGLRRGGT